MLSKKTRKGQPNLNLQMEYLLQKIQGTGKWHPNQKKTGLNWLFFLKKKKNPEDDQDYREILFSVVFFFFILFFSPVVCPWKSNTVPHFNLTPQDGIVRYEETGKYAHVRHFDQ